jgi:two-component system NtrC family response regulator
LAVNCAAIPDALLESELFGHERGAFTGADQRRVGKFEQCNGGTLFLDEIGELPKPMQAKLLRFLESGEVRRVGENESFTVDVRVICATHRDLQHMVDEGDFREDLMFRINTFEIRLPALRSRSEDIPELAAHLMSRFRRSPASSEDLFTPETLDALCRHRWPGNVRELANVIEYATILCDSGPVKLEHLPSRFEHPLPVGPQLKSTGPLTLREIEMQAIYSSLERLGGNKPKAAEELGISLKTLYNKLNQSSALEKSA